MILRISNKHHIGNSKYNKNKLKSRQNIKNKTILLITKSYKLEMKNNKTQTANPSLKVI